MWFVVAVAMIFVRLMTVSMFFVPAAPATEEHHENLARHIEGRQECGKRRQAPGEPVAMKRGEQDFVLAEETRCQRKTRQRQRANDITNKGDRHVLAQSAHFAHVLLMVCADNHATGT